jgi:hypothetical protein
MKTFLTTGLLVCLGVTALGGCGGTETPPEKKRVAPADRNVLMETVKRLEEDVTHDDVRQETLMSVIAALREVHVKMRRESVGTAEDREEVLFLIDRFEAVRSTGGPIDRNTREPDGPEEPLKPGHARILTGPVRTLLGELRALAESLE